MKTVFICFFPAWPPTSGAAAVSYACAKYWPGERTLVQLADGLGNQVTPDGVEIQNLPCRRSRVGKLFSIIRCAFTILAHCRAAQPDTIVLEGASWVGYHWYLLRLLRITSVRARLVYHAHNVEYVLRKCKHGRIVQLLTRLCERSVVRGVDLATAVSDVDQREFASLYGVTPHLLPNGIDLDSAKATSPALADGMRRKYGLCDSTVLFMGLYQYRPNTEAVDFLVRDVMPVVLKRHPKARLAIIGGTVPFREPWLINPGCIPSEEVVPFIHACTVGVAPIFSGSGTRLKILEYMAAGLPVIATAKGAEGLGLRPDVHYLLAESAEEFARRLDEVLSGRPVIPQIAAHSQEAVRKRFAWPGLIEEFTRTSGDHSACLAQPRRTAERQQIGQATDSFAEGQIQFVVPTKDRPQELRNLLASLARQTVPIAGVTIVDSSSEPQTGLADEFPSLAITYVGGHEASAAAQRNTGIALVPPEVQLIGLVDDDMLLAPDCVEKALGFWRAGPPELGGTAFNVLNHPRSRGKWLKRSTLCRWLGLYMPDPGQVARSGWHTVPDLVTTDTWADWLMSGAAVWRREVFAEHGFDPFFTGYSYLEDLDFSYSVSRRWRLAIVAGAHCWHHPSPSGRISPYEFGKIEVRNRLYFVRKHRLSVARCYLGLTLRFGSTLFSALFTPQRRTVGRALGNLTSLSGTRQGRD